MLRESVPTTTRTTPSRGADENAAMVCSCPTSGRAMTARTAGFAQRLLDHLYDLVDRRTRERFEHRRLPL